MSHKFEEQGYFCKKMPCFFMHFVFFVTNSKNFFPVSLAITEVEGSNFVRILFKLKYSFYTVIIICVNSVF